MEDGIRLLFQEGMHNFVNILKITEVYISVG